MNTPVSVERTTPTFGVVSAVLPLVGVVGLTLGVHADSGYGVVLALACVVFAPVLGLFFGAVSLFLRERHPLIAVLGMLESVTFVLLFWRLLWDVIG